MFPYSLICCLLLVDSICGSLGGADRFKDKKVKLEEGEQAREAGLAKLGLWLGERLLGRSHTVVLLRRSYRI